MIANPSVSGGKSSQLLHVQISWAIIRETDYFDCCYYDGNNATLVHIEYPDILDINIPAGIITFQTSYKGGIGIRSEGFEIVDEFNTGPTSANAQIDIVYVFGDCRIARY